MSYIINKTDGTTLVTLDPGVLDQSTSLYLIGKNYPNYGELQQENFVRLLENFANTTEPNAPLVGQLWYDTDAKNQFNARVNQATAAEVADAIGKAKVMAEQFVVWAKANGYKMPIKHKINLSISKK
jgi:hypothetical protein